ncbi:inositol polyphosphate multikinase isoform X2 [Taeniopygia guttata]|uniref:inositol polyphosphate multikinase isoform X2 n=1 Tax=Taeniopygia guttata TaxID=59729 RepID=UPI003BB8F2D4
MATEPPRPAGRPEGGRGCCAGGGRGETEEAEAAAQPVLGASPGPAAAGGGRRRALNGCVPLSHQVAGHMHTAASRWNCPEAVAATTSWSQGARVLQQDTYLKLEDVTRKFNKPCIMDVKIGQKSYDPYASAEKIQQQVSKYPLMEEIGFLVLGMRVYHVSSDSYETQNQHYGRSLTKETVKDGISKFFHSGYCLRKDVVAASIQKVEKILEWFEGQTQLNFYASSLLFVYEGSCPATTVQLSDVTLAEKRRVPKGLLSGGDVLEYNNNIHVINSTENGKIEASVGKGLSKFYALHKKACSKRHHSQLSLKVENSEQDNVWKTSTCITQEHLNGNVLPQLEKVFYHMPAETKESANVEVRMIDFAHVFPSNTKDEGYIYGLKNLITVLQNILDN